MRTIKDIAAMQKFAIKAKKNGQKIAFVPTMGFLHEGHLNLIKKARQICKKDGIVIVSIYVNPTQFGPKEDFSKYPRDLNRDLKLCKSAGADIVFTPSDAAMYPNKSEGLYSVYVVEEELSKTMEGASRPTHFRGVTTVVAKLFNIIQPDVAIFGEKDYQQAAIIRRMTENLNFPVKIVVAPTVREPDGLAMSSRNTYLNESERKQANVLFRTINLAREKVRSSKQPLNASDLKAELKSYIEKEPSAHVDYIEFFHPDTLKTVETVKPGHHMALAVYIGTTRLIDNGRL
ncbi:MAG: pantoate--beta-alanine ligase [Verrucomicrobiae bacterium]|nr:pantoate--beta-alanine ligase [Verrucomicrobiae bacterium]